MVSNVKAIPDGYHSVTPYLSVKDASGAIDFYKRAFGAREIFRLPMPDGTVGHAELQIGDSRIMLADENEMSDAVIRSPRTLHGTSMGLSLYVPDVDRTFAQAVEAGGVVKRPLKDQFYGDRTGTVEDPFGHVWTLATHVENVSDDEMKKRLAALPKT